jgi:hypothetical protein
MKSPWLEIVLWLILFALTAVLYIPFYILDRIPNGYHKLKIFLIRRLMWPAIVVFAIFGDLTHEDFWSLLGLGVLLGGLDQFCKWADRKTPNDHPLKYF